MSFQLSKLIIFNVDYYTLGSNSSAHFSTSADEFVRNKKDFGRCGQAQDDLLKGFNVAMAFYKKWDNKHLSDLTIDEYNEMTKDLEKLKEHYNFIEEEPSRFHSHISFYNLVEFSKQEPKRIKKEMI